MVPVAHIKTSKIEESSDSTKIIISIDNFYRWRPRFKTREITYDKQNWHALILTAA